jgi:hypothetical protein
MERLPLSFLPGDLVFFRAYDALSLGISYRTCTWRQLFSSPLNGGFLPSHVGVCADYEGSQDDWKTRGARTLLFESTTKCDQPCFIQGRQVEGVQAHLPDVRIRNYPGKAWRLRLRRPLDRDESARLSAFCAETVGHPYNYLRAAELATFFVRRIHGDPLPDSWFCSDHALTAYKCINRVNQDDDPEDYSPGRFAQLVLHSGAVFPIKTVPAYSCRIK